MVAACADKEHPSLVAWVGIQECLVLVVAALVAAVVPEVHHHIGVADLVLDHNDQAVEDSPEEVLCH